MKQFCFNKNKKVILTISLATKAYTEAYASCFNERNLDWALSKLKETIEHE